MARFSEILTIINGRNQKQVENPNGEYPIYGSGGMIGYADDFICDGETVIIGRKGDVLINIGRFQSIYGPLDIGYVPDMVINSFVKYLSDIHMLSGTIAYQKIQNWSYDKR